MCPVPGVGLSWLKPVDKLKDGLLVLVPTGPEMIGLSIPSLGVKPMIPEIKSELTNKILLTMIKSLQETKHCSFLKTIKTCF